MVTSYPTPAALWKTALLQEAGGLVARQADCNLYEAIFGRGTILIELPFAKRIITRLPASVKVRPRCACKRAQLGARIRMYTYLL